MDTQDKTDGEGNKRARYKTVMELLQSLIKGIYIMTDVHLLVVPYQVKINAVGTISNRYAGQRIWQRKKRLER
jgi:hypothetical protein